jgi:hypothetical protein
MKGKLMREKIFMVLFTVAVASTTFAGKTESLESNLSQYPSHPGESWKDRLILYIPNRVVDFLDIIDASVGFGPAVKAKIWVTRYLALGAGVGGSAKLIKAYNRQYGAGLESGWNASFLMLSAEDTEMYDTTRGVQKYFLYHTGVPSIDDSVYNFWHGPRDIFSIGAELALFLDLHLELHPFEAIDFLAGIFFLDPKGDDFTMKEIESQK